MNIRRPFVIITAARPHLTDALNAARNAELQEHLQAANLFPICIWMRRDANQFKAFIVHLPIGNPGYAMSQLASLATRYGQHVVTYVDARGYAAHYRPNKPEQAWALQWVEELGPFREAPSHDALSRVCWYERDGRYFLAGSPATLPIHDYYACAC